MRLPFGPASWLSSLAVSATALAACDPPDKLQLQRDAGEERSGESPPGDDSETSESACGSAKVDLLFVIDNSGSMSQEQAKLTRAVPQLLGILATGNHSGKRSAPGEPTDFVPAQSIHVGVTSTDLGINLAPSVSSCGDRSFDPAEQDPLRAPLRVNKPFGDDGALLTSTAVAVAGISIRQSGADDLSVVVPPDPSCGELELEQPFLEYEPGDLFEDTSADFSCISKLGKNGCGFEQQLEAMLKALTPARATRYDFSRDSHGQGTAPGKNVGFLREDAILAVIHVSDEEDCSIPDTSSAIFDPSSSAFAGEVNVRCGLSENQGGLHRVERYVEGLQALKPAHYRDRILFSAVVGMPLAADLDGLAVHSGQDDLQAILARPDMHFVTQRNPSDTADEPKSVCVSPSGDGSAAPGRRFLELAAALGDNGAVTSICEDSYQSLVAHLSERISRQLDRCK